MGAFSHKFSIAPSGKTTDQIKKVRGRKNGTDLLYHHAKYGRDRGSRDGCRRKSVIFLSVFLFFFLGGGHVFVLRSFGNGNAVTQRNFQNNYSAIAYRMFCSCAPTFSFLNRSQVFP